MPCTGRGAWRRRNSPSTRSLERNPYRPALKMLALTRQRLGDTQGAERILRHTVPLIRISPKPSWSWAICLWTRGACPRGWTCCAGPPCWSRIRLRSGTTWARGLFRQGDNEAAERALRRSLELRPDETVALVTLGRVLAAHSTLGGGPVHVGQGPWRTSRATPMRIRSWPRSWRPWDCLVRPPPTGTRPWASGAATRRPLPTWETSWRP